jgi:hypothetical protein
MARPLSTSLVPALGGYPDHSLAIGNLWRIFIAVLIEWSSASGPETCTLLNAIAKALGLIHKGGALDDQGKTLMWSSFAYFSTIWHETTGADIQPGQIFRQYCDSTFGRNESTEALFENEGCRSSWALPLELSNFT